MGDCRYCHNPAGFLRSQHAECRQKDENGVSGILDAIAREPTGSSTLLELPLRTANIAKESFISDNERAELYLKSWSNGVDKVLEDGLLTDEEEKHLIKLAEALGLKQDDLNSTGAMMKLTKAAVIKDVLSGIIPKRATFDGSLPINFQKGEQVVWAFPNSKYLEDKTYRQYVGASQGISVRLMQGVYYRVGAFKGQPVESTERVHVDTGWAVVTTKNIYFVGARTSMRVPYVKIVSFDPFSDGLGVMRDTNNAKLQVFATGDGWFTYNLVRNLSQM